MSFSWGATAGRENQGAPIRQRTLSKRGENQNTNFKPNCIDRADRAEVISQRSMPILVVGALWVVQIHMVGHVEHLPAELQVFGSQ